MHPGMPMKKPYSLEKNVAQEDFSSQQVPADFQDPLPDASLFPYVVFLPEQSDGFVKTASRQMVVLTGSELIHMTRKKS
jgi:hypothetical protein